jgi:hypothetical protein
VFGLTLLVNFHVSLLNLVSYLLKGFLIPWGSPHSFVKKKLHGHILPYFVVVSFPTLSPKSSPDAQPSLTRDPPNQCRGRSIATCELWPPVTSHPARKPAMGPRVRSTTVTNYGHLSRSRSIRFNLNYVTILDHWQQKS